MKSTTKWLAYASRLLCLLLIFSGSLYAQDFPKINKHFENKALKIVLIELKYEYNLVFEYEKSLIEEVIIKEISINRLPLDQALEVMLRDTDITFSISGNTVSLFERVEYVPTIYSAKRFGFILKGRVEDERSGESLPHATIMVQGTRIGSNSNDDGYFTIREVPADTVTLIVKYLGYQTRNFKITPETDIEKVFISLRAIDFQMQEVMIVAEEEHMMESKGISHLSISPAQLAALPSLGEKDIFRSLQLMPGVSGTNENSSGLYVRGGTPDQNLILLDGFTVYHVDHFFGFFSAFNADAIKDVQFYKGGFSAKYGERLSSVVELSGKSGNKNKFDAGLNISALSISGRVEGPIGKKATFFLAARRSYTDIIQSGLYDNIYDLVTPATETGGGGVGGPGGGRFVSQVTPDFYFYDLNARLTYNPTEKDVLSISFYNGIDNLDNSFDNSQTGFGRGPVAENNTFTNNTIDLTRWGNWGASTRWSRQWNDRWYSNATLAYSNYFSNRDRSTEIRIERDTSITEINRGTVEDNNVQDLTFRFNNELILSTHNQLDLGTQLTYNDISYNLVQNDTISILDQTGTGSRLAFYAQDHWQPLKWLSLSGGARTTYYDVTDQWYLEPRAQASIQLGKRIKLQGAWGEYYQFTNRVIREDILQGSRDFWLLADGENIPVGKATHYIAGLSYEMPKYLFSAEAYRKPLVGLTEYTQRLSGGRGGVDIEELFYNGNGIAQGIELLAQKKVGQYTGWISYTLSEVMYEFPDFSDTPFPALHDQTHEFKMVHSYQLDRWEFGGTWVYSTGHPYSSPVGGYQLELLDGTSFDYVNVGDKNSFRLPAYHRLDLSATFKFNMGALPASFGLSVFNVYNRQNIWYKEFEVVDGDLLETDVTFLGITPNFFFNIKLR